jgi:uncharacterized protein (UPF0332 family)
MSLNENERNTLVNLRLQKAKDTLHEARLNVDLGCWHTAANRLYYACYYAASALLIKHGHQAQTHSGVIKLLGLHFISKGMISKESGKFYRRLFELRQKGDYDDWSVIKATDVQAFVEPAEEFIHTLEKLILA